MRYLIGSQWSLHNSGVKLLKKRNDKNDDKINA